MKGLRGYVCSILNLLSFNMVNYLFAIIFLALGLGCARIFPPPSHNNIIFSFKASTVPAWGFSNSDSTDIEVTCSLTNPNSDTVYFVSTSCYGPRFYLQYENSLFGNYSTVTCPSMSFIIEKIPPGDRIEFTTHFYRKKPSKELILGFDFFEVDKDLKEEDIYKFKLVPWRPKRKPKHQNILWADIHRFE